MKSLKVRGNLLRPVGMVVSTCAWRSERRLAARLLGAEVEASLLVFGNRSFDRRPSEAAGITFSEVCTDKQDIASIKDNETIAAIDNLSNSYQVVLALM